MNNEPSNNLFAGRAPNRGKTVAFRVSEEELATLNRRMVEEDRPLSAILRRAMRAYLNTQADDYR